MDSTPGQCLEKRGAEGGGTGGDKGWGSTVLTPRGEVGSEKPRASLIDEAVVLNLRPSPNSDSRRPAVGEEGSSLSSMADVDSLGGG